MKKRIQEAFKRLGIDITKEWEENKSWFKNQRKNTKKANNNHNKLKPYILYTRTS